MNVLAQHSTKLNRLNDDAWSNDRRPTVVLADDHGIITDGLRHLLEPECEVVAIVGDGNALVDAALSFHPDIVVVDITMPLLNGIDAARQLLSDLPRTHVIFLTMHADRTQRQVLQLIVEGYSTKEIGIRLTVSPKTVEFHKYRLIKGLGLTSSVQLVQFALQHGLIA